MTFKIEYPSKLTANNKDIVIFVSNLSQLKNTEFLPDSDFYLKSNQFIKQINSKNYFLLQNIKKNNSLLNIMVVLLKSSKNSKIILNSSLTRLFVSIDAATSETYDKVRIPVNKKTLLKENRLKKIEENVINFVNLIILVGFLHMI